ncbi:hypothetical protein niasHT_014071 [Heterodera trifolii]|uniref:Uncharacterized protein n=1 Tax=Heterodera trifolii TaxID=157864 RepID=A0ABD2LG83_9BILA
MIVLFFGLDPSVGVGVPDDALPNVAQLRAEDRTAAEATIAQLLPNGRLKQRLEQLMPQCQDMVRELKGAAARHFLGKLDSRLKFQCQTLAMSIIEFIWQCAAYLVRSQSVSSCVLRGHQLSGFDCCRMVQPWLATPRAGICWPFVVNSSASLQSPLDNARGIQITFQISRNSFRSGALSVHPGLSVHLVSPHLPIGPRLRVATSLDSAAHAHALADKRSLRLDIRKKIVADAAASPFFPSSGICSSDDSIAGPSPPSAVDATKGAAAGSAISGAVGGLLCLLERAVEQCSCVPMIVVLWTLQGDLDSAFLRRFNASTICTVVEFDHCVHPFVEFAMPPAWEFYPTPSEAGAELHAAVDTCRKGSPRVCRHEKFPARSKERELPPEYQNTEDFVSRLSVSFDSFLVTELSSSKEMDVYKLLASFGYNLWWFAIGHLLWTVCRLRLCHPLSPNGSAKGNGSANNKVSPKSPMVPPTVGAAAAATNSTTTTTMANNVINAMANSMPPNSIANANSMANAMATISPKERNSENISTTNSVPFAAANHALPSTFIEQPPKMGVHPLSPPRALPRAGARQLPPLTIGRGGVGNSEMATIMTDDGGTEPTNHCRDGEEEPPQRRRRGPKLALDELDG